MHRKHYWLAALIFVLVMGMSCEIHEVGSFPSRKGTDARTVKKKDAKDADAKDKKANGKKSTKVESQNEGIIDRVTSLITGGGGAGSSNSICIKSDQMRIADVSIKDSEARVRREFGNPSRSRGVTRGGGNKTLVYNNAEVDVVWGEVEAIRTSSSRARFGPGVQVGMHFDEVMDLLGLAAQSGWKGQERITFINCDDSEMMSYSCYLTLEFDDRDKLKSIEISSDAP